MNVNYIIQNVERNCDVRIFIDQFADNDECAFYIPEEKAIGINPNISDQEAIESIVHEVAHHVDIYENNNPERRDIDGEVIAHAVEEIVFWNAPVQGVIDEVVDDIREGYGFDEDVQVDEDEISFVADRVREVCNFF